MRKYYLDNIRWVTVVLVVLYHVVYMYNGVQLFGVVGPFRAVQYQDAYLYMVYPWFMVLLFVVSGISARLYLNHHSHKEFIGAKTRKLLVPSTLGLFVIGWIQGYYNMQISNAFETLTEGIPGFITYLIMAVSGTGVLWYIQMLWCFSMLLVVVRLMERDRLYQVCAKANIVVLLLLTVFIFLSAQILNTPVVTVYRFGIYGLSFFIGYFILSHEEVVEKLSVHWLWLSVVAILLGVLYVVLYFGENYAAEPVINNVLSCVFCWISVLAVLAVMKSKFDKTGKISAYMTKKSWGLYVFHYLPISMVAYYQHRYAPNMPALFCYLLCLVAAFLGAFGLYEIISRIPVIRWFALGIKGSSPKEKR